MTDQVDQYRDWDAAYVLGALGPDDRRAYERHLATCPSCSAAVAELAGIPGILAHLSTDDAVALTAVPLGDPVPEHRPPDLVQRLARTTIRRRRRMRAGLATLATVAAAVFLVAGVLIGGAITPTPDLADPEPSPSSTVPVLAMAQVEPGVMTAELQVTEKGWGTRFDWTCQYLIDDWDRYGGSSAPQDFVMVATDDAGNETTVATWTATDATAGGLVASSSLRTGDIRTVEIRLAGTGTPLVRSEL